MRDVRCSMDKISSTYLKGNLAPVSNAPMYWHQKTPPFVQSIGIECKAGDYDVAMFDRGMDFWTSGSPPGGPLRAHAGEWIAGGVASIWETKLDWACEIPDAKAVEIRYGDRTLLLDQDLEKQTRHYRYGLELDEGKEGRNEELEMMMLKSARRYLSRNLDMRLQLDDGPCAKDWVSPR